MTSISPIYEFFNEHRLPLFRGDQDLCSYLEKHFSEFLNELDLLVDNEKDEKIFKHKLFSRIKNNHKIISVLCDAIVKTLKLYQNGELVDAYESFFRIMDRIQKKIALCDIDHGLNILPPNLFRIRPSQSQYEINDRIELFHIPFNKNIIVKPYRYSIAGFPCLYLSTDILLCWLECDMPPKFFYSQFQHDTNSSMILLDFRRSPFSFIKGLRSRALNGLNDNNAIISYLITYPLIAACSLIVREKNKPFVPEYIIPQILLAWIRKNKKYRGIAYFTCSKYDDAREVHSYNIVIPPVEVSTHVHCGRLEKEFKLTSPQFCDIPKFFGSFSSNFEKVKSIRTKLHEIVTKSEYFFDPMREILSAYDSLIIIIDRITSNDNPDIEMLYQYLDTTSKILYQLTNKEYLNQINDQINNLNKTEDFRTIALKICKDVWDDLNYVYIQSSQFWYFGLNSLETNLDFQSIHPI